jgi:hypothetical protein
MQGVPYKRWVLRSVQCSEPTLPRLQRCCTMDAAFMLMLEEWSVEAAAQLESLDWTNQVRTSLMKIERLIVCAFSFGHTLRTADLFDRLWYQKANTENQSQSPSQTNPQTSVPLESLEYLLPYRLRKHLNSSFNCPAILIPIIHSSGSHTLGSIGTSSNIMVYSKISRHSSLGNFRLMVSMIPVRISE